MFPEVPAMNRSLICAAVFASCLVSGVLWACQSPVFRYALERWKPGTWQLVVVSSGRLSREQQLAFEKLQATVVKGLPLRVRHIDLSDAAEPERSFWTKIRERGGKDAVVVAAMYPDSSAVDQPVASVLPLTLETAREITSSPAREELVRRLCAGHSAVWLFVDSGVQETDDAAFLRLQQQLQKEAARLKLPAAAELLVTEEFLQQVRIPLMLEFSIIRIRQDDMREQFLLDCLLNSEEDLRGLAEPLAFPVFGRGRVLYSLAGKGIAAATISDACNFLTGACSCEVKEQNPGFDLLIEADWGQAVGEKLISSPTPAEEARPKLLAIPPGRRAVPAAEQTKP
jgi:hypothetical protein